MLLTQNGCSLNEEQRPSYGLAVKPTKIGGPCESRLNVRETFEWLKYSDILEKLIKYYTGRSLKEELTYQLMEKLILIDKINLEDLNEMQKIFYSIYFNIIENKPYYSTDEVKKFLLKL